MLNLKTSPTALASAQVFVQQPWRGDSSVYDSAYWPGGKLLAQLKRKDGSRSALIPEIKKAFPAGSAERMVLEATAASIPPVICRGGINSNLDSQSLQFIKTE